MENSILPRKNQYYTKSHERQYCVEGKNLTTPVHVIIHQENIFRKHDLSCGKSIINNSVGTCIWKVQSFMGEERDRNPAQAVYSSENNTYTTLQHNGSLGSHVREIRSFLGTKTRCPSGTSCIISWTMRGMAAPRMQLTKKPRLLEFWEQSSTSRTRWKLYFLEKEKYTRHESPTHD